MKDRRFLIGEIDSLSDSGEVKGKGTVIGEVELKRRLLMLTAGDYREGDIDILINGERDQGELTYKELAYSLIDDKPSTSPTRAEWEAWLDDMPDELSLNAWENWQLDMKQWFRDMPIVPKE